MIVDGKAVAETEGLYGGPWVYQQYLPAADFEGNYPVIGSWMVNGYACGIGIREDHSPVTQNTSRFVPHVFTRDNQGDRMQFGWPPPTSLSALLAAAAFGVLGILMMLLATRSSIGSGRRSTCRRDWPSGTTSRWRS